MTVEHLPDLHPPAFGDVIDASRPILSFAWESEEAHRVASHAHPRGHIIQVEQGACWATTPEGRWLVPSGQGIWVPPWIHHEVLTRGPVAARVIFVDPAYSEPLPAAPGTVAVSPLLAELIRRACAFGNDYPEGGRESRLARVMLDEFAAMEPTALLVPASEDQRLGRAMARLIETPSAAVGLRDVARGSGASERTLARLFVRETGMTWTEWRTRLILVEAIDRLSRGTSVSRVAIELGYSTPSSFTYMFRKNLGVSPGTYWDCEDGGRH